MRQTVVRLEALVVVVSRERAPPVLYRTVNCTVYSVQPASAPREAELTEAKKYAQLLELSDSEAARTT